MNKSIVYITDLDMTLLNSKAELSPFAKLNINHLIKNGVNFTVASARSVVSIKPIFQGVDLRLPIIEFNGAFISDLKTGEHKIINDMDKSAVNYIHQTIVAFKENFFLSTFNGIEDRLYYSKTTNPGEERYVNDRTKKNDSRLRKTADIDAHFDERIVCFTIIDLEEELKPLRDAISSCDKNIEMHFQENHYFPGWFWLTVHSNLATKDLAIKQLLRQCDMSDADVTVFGDNTNDIKMFKYATKSIAVENACWELKEVADIVIGNNEDHSVIKYIAEGTGLELIGFKA